MKNQIVFYVLVLFVNYAYSAPKAADFEKSILLQYNLFKTAKEFIDTYEGGASLLSGMDPSMKTLPLEKAKLTNKGILFTKSKTLLHVTNFSPLTFSIDGQSVVVDEPSKVWPKLEFLNPKKSSLWNLIVPPSFAEDSGSTKEISVKALFIIAYESFKKNLTGGRMTYPPSSCMTAWKAFKTVFFSRDVTLVGPPNCDKTKPTLNLKFQGILGQFSEVENGTKVYNMKIPTANGPVSVVLDPNNPDFGSWRIMKSEDGKPDVEMRSQGYSSWQARRVVFSELVQKRNSFSNVDVEHLQKGAVIINALNENEYDTNFDLIDWCLSCRDVPEVKTQVFGESAQDLQEHSRPAN